MNHNNTKCTGCIKCIDACPGKALVKELVIPLNQKSYTIAKYISQKCLMCWTTDNCDAAKVCDHGCFEVR